MGRTSSEQGFSLGRTSSEQGFSLGRTSSEQGFSLGRTSFWQDFSLGRTSSGNLSLAWMITESIFNQNRNLSSVSYNKTKTALQQTVIHWHWIMWSFTNAATDSVVLTQSIRTCSETINTGSSLRAIGEYIGSFVKVHIQKFMEQ